MAGLDLAHRHEQRVPGDTCTFAGSPFEGERVKTVTDRRLHEPMPRRVELDLVDATAVPVVSVQLRRVLVGKVPLVEPVRRSDLSGERFDVVGRPRGTLACNSRGQHRVRRVEVVVGERRRLVEDVVGLHGRTVSPDTDDDRGVLATSGPSAVW